MLSNTLDSYQHFGETCCLQNLLQKTIYEDSISLKKKYIALVYITYLIWILTTDEQFFSAKYLGKNSKVWRCT